MKKFFILLGLILLTQKQKKVCAQTNLSKEEQIVLTEVVIKDSIPAKELLKRATHWAQSKHAKYEKINAVGGNTKVELDAFFKIKPKELNPTQDYTGKIIMHVKIEVKDGKYKYTINQIKHVADNGKNSGGDIAKNIPECGSMFLPDLTWKKIKSEALKDANFVAEDIKDAFSAPVKETSEDW